jgi:hypothetical protein
MERRATQLAALTGAAAVILLVVGSFIVPTMPKVDASAASTQSYFVDHRTGVRVSVYLLGLALALFVWFLGTIRAHLRQSEGNDGRLSAVAFGGGLATVSAFSVGLMAEAALAFSARTAGPATNLALYDFLAVNAAIVAFLLIPFAGAIAVVGFRHHALPSWLSAGFAVFAVYEFLEAAAFSASTGAFAPGNALNTVGLIAFAVLVFVLSLWLTQQTGRSVSNNA